MQLGQFCLCLTLNKPLLGDLKWLPGQSLEVLEKENQFSINQLGFIVLFLMTHFNSIVIVILVLINLMFFNALLHKTDSGAAGPSHIDPELLQIYMQMLKPPLAGLSCLKDLKREVIDHSL